MRIPGFIARQFYVAGSLRNVADGFELQAQNPMGDGVLVGVGQITVDGRAIEPSSVSARRSHTEERISARDVSRSNPVRVTKGDRVTLHISGGPLARGDHTLEVELVELNMGQLSFSISDRIAG